MSTIGWQEVFLVMFFALIVFGPKRLPDIGRQIGRAVREIRRVSGDFQREIQTYTGDFAAEAREFEREVKTNFALDADHSRFITPTAKAKASSDGAARLSGDASGPEPIPAPERPQPAPDGSPPTPSPPIPAPERPQPTPTPDEPRG